LCGVLPSRSGNSNQQSDEKKIANAYSGERYFAEHEFLRLGFAERLATSWLGLMGKVLLTGISDLAFQLRHNTPLLLSHTANSERISGGEDFQIANWRFEISDKGGTGDSQRKKGHLLRVPVANSLSGKWEKGTMPEAENPSAL
jgi:hypothetical protein